MRLAHTHVCPVFRYLEAINPVTAASRSASSNTINGALPPNSRLTFLTVPLAWRIRSLPTGVDPVNDTLRTAGLVVSSSPTCGARSFEQVTMLRIPGGTPASSANTASASAHNGVSSAGLTTTGQPAASAGATLRVIMATGKFQGVIAATTPIGCLITTILLSRPWPGMTSP